ncbi:hypothetical protein G6M50_06085 [Agrobacterium rhizogenes]|nr:hypothetical protein [Rhizobium rhizogenes]NTJ77371.1 hypothetical protein [Rhizobium rhizogenes]
MNLSLRGENSNSRKLANKRHGFEVLPASDPWSKRAASIFQRCKRTGLEFGFASSAELAIYLKNIAPLRCPVFGFELITSDQKGGFNPRSPSVDRIDSSKGYTRDNIQIISMKANTMKTDATLDDLLAFAEWIMATNAMSAKAA